MATRLERKKLVSRGWVGREAGGEGRVVNFGNKLRSFIIRLTYSGLAFFLKGSNFETKDNTDKFQLATGGNADR